MLTTQEKIQNYNQFRSIITDNFSGDRLNRLNTLYDDYKERLKNAPASSYNYFHNAFPGGYCDHVLRVLNFSKTMYKFYKSAGLEVDNFTLEELIFSALNHDLGKLGFPGEDLDEYIVNKSKWHVENQGKVYEKNKIPPYATVSDKTMYILQKYGLVCTWNEYQAIKIHDGIYDEANKSYYTGFSLESKMKCNLPLILHMSDHMASRFEFERWVKNENNFKLDSINEWDIKIKKSIDTITKSNNNVNFDDL